ncbi:hypothetical protein D910_09814 [Dendroctonus ponderosae]|uniref:Phosphodiesterase n=1 Tax=Dendroctonus ponderosae TaxID=77166 RepID=U4UQR7_DENPD|nr:hypothetical protein D910_09814 [Dendroctonus ponderosae]
MSKQECSHPDPDLFIAPPYCKKNGNPDDDSPKDFQLPDEVSISKVELLESLTDASTRKLEAKLNRYLKTECEAKFSFMINLHSIAEEAAVHVIQERILADKLTAQLTDEAFSAILDYQTNSLTAGATLDPKIQLLIREVVPEGTGDVVIVPVLARDRKGTNKHSVQNAASHLRAFLETEAAYPVILVCIVNPTKDSGYISKIVSETFRYCLTIILNTRECEDQRRLKAECQKLLLVARKLFSHLGDLSDLLKEIMSEARRLTNAERCSLFLLDPDHMHLVAKVFDGVSPEERSTEVRIAADQGIAGHVAATGEILNIKDAYKHPLFYKGMDEATGFKTRNILCFPIRDEDSIVGVAQLCNKEGGHFDYFDEQVANAFSIYCGISIMHSLVYKKIQDAQARSRLSNELMMYHMQLVEKGYFTQLEALAYFVSCLCHDIDHRGTTNSFQQQSNSVLASLYSSEGSVMERHHLSQTICTLNTEGCNFLDSLSKDDYVKCLDLIKDMILATDLASHYKIHSRQLAMAQEGYDKIKPENRFYLASLLMTCADLSDQTKDWTETKKVAQLIYAEFFAQGDLEKKMGKEPANMMDREKASIPDHQLEFLTQCCICIFRILAAVFPNAKVLVDAIKQNILCWESSKRIFNKLCVEGVTSYEVLVSEELESEVQNTLDNLND